MATASEIRVRLKLEDIRALNDSRPELLLMREQVKRAHMLTDEQAQTFMERLLVSSLSIFGESYTSEMNAHIERIFSLRDQLSEIFETAITGRSKGERTQATNVEELFGELEHELDAVKSPERAAQAPTGVDQLIDQIAGDVRAQMSEAAPSVRRIFEPGMETHFRNSVAAMDPATQAVLLRATELAHRDVLQVFTSEIGPTTYQRANPRGVTYDYANPRIERLINRMRTSGMNETDLGLLRGALEELNRAGIVAREDPSTLPGQMLESARQQGLAHITDPELRRVAQNSGYLKDLAHQGAWDDPNNPPHLLRLWDRFLRYREEGGQLGFERYVLFRMRREVRGTLGEFTAAFILGGAFGSDFYFLKGPRYDSTMRGTDLVGIVRSTGDVWLIDNKAWSSNQVGTVGALTKNLRSNMANDIAEFRIADDGRPDIDPHVQSAVDRIDNALRTIDGTYGNLSNEAFNAPSVQQDVARILRDNGIRRVVQNAGGEVSGVSDALQRTGIAFDDLNGNLNQ